MATSKKSSASAAAPKALAEAKLLSSGLSLEDAKTLKIDILTAPQAVALGHDNLPSLRLNYITPDGKPLRSWPGTPPFYRLRYLADLKTDFPVEARPQRYTQPAGGSCCAYFPQNADWEALVADASAPLAITEGELKAACACKFGVPTIGLGGVHNWHALPKGVTFLPELEAINWVGRYVYLVFDSDYVTNPKVLGALKALADEMVERGAFPLVVTLPSLVEGEKTGLDDYLVAEGLHALHELMNDSIPLGLTKPLFDFNKRYIYVRDPGLILAQESMAKIAPGAFKDHLEAAKVYQERSLGPEGVVKHKAVSAAGAWLGWPLRSEADRITYAPGQERLVGREFNIWPGWGVQPKAGDVKPFLELVKHLFTGTEPEAVEWFLDWCAYPLQHPGTKLYSAVVLHGSRTGTGKSLMGYTLGRIYGKNFTEINEIHLQSPHNEWAEAKQLVMGDDVTGSDKREHADHLKKLITQNELRINIKYIPSYVVPDYVNYFFTSNRPDAFFMDDDDRRYGIFEILVGPHPEKDFYEKYAGPGGKAWLDNGGAGAIFDWMLKRDLKKRGFNPFGHAFRTQARARMISDVQSDLGAWVRGLLSAPEAVLKMDKLPLERDLFTSKQLLALYDPIGKTGTTANGLGRELRRAGVQQACGGQPVKLIDGTQARYYVIRNAHAWLKATTPAVQTHLNGSAAKGLPTNKF